MDRTIKSSPDWENDFRGYPLASEGGDWPACGVDCAAGTSRGEDDTPVGPRTCSDRLRPSTPRATPDARQPVFCRKCLRFNVMH